MQRTGGELVLDSLKAAGVDTAFGIISVHNIPIFDAMAREAGVRLVPARTEHGAAAMADGFARATGRLAAVITSTGVGAANAAGPLLEAFSGQVRRGPYVTPFLTTIGRRKFLLPLYRALLSVGRTADARRIYASARPGYHPITQTSLDDMLGTG